MGSMKDQLGDTLFDYKPPPAAYARATDPRTSHAAAASVNVPEKELAVLRCLAAMPSGGTVDEVTRRSGIDKVTVSPRFKPLLEKGFIVVDGLRFGESGRQQRVHFITNKGRDALA